MSPGVIGGVAGFLTSIAILPQIIKTWRTRHARDLSLWQQIIVMAGLVLWLAYGLMLGDLPLIVSNAFTLFCYALLLTMKIVFDRDDKRRINVYLHKDYPHKGGHDETDS